VGTVLLNTCQVIERPSKKDGFCFKLFHPLEQSIWAPRGPEKEAIGIYIYIFFVYHYVHYIYIYLYIYTHTYIHTYIHTYTVFITIL